MTKEGYYMALRPLFVKLAFRSPFAQTESEKANLAYFIDGYCDTRDWDQLYKTVRRYAETGNVPALCLLLAEKIYMRVMRHPRISDKYSKAYQFHYRILRRAYETGTLDTFAIVGKPWYPEWFYHIEWALSD